jgi:hypothetical protein
LSTITPSSRRHHEGTSPGSSLLLPLRQVRAKSARLIEHWRAAFLARVRVLTPQLQAAEAAAQQQGLSWARQQGRPHAMRRSCHEDGAAVYDGLPLRHEIAMLGQAAARKRQVGASDAPPHAQPRNKVANRDGRGFGWEMSSRGRLVTPTDFPRHDCSSYSHAYVRRERLGSVPRSRTIFCHPVPNLSVPIRNFRITVHINRRTAERKGG